MYFPLFYGYLVKMDGSGFSHQNVLDISSFYHPFFLTIVFWQVFSLFHSTNFEFLSGMLLSPNINGSSSFYKGPQICKVSKSADPSDPWTFRL
jgi:hypothetical protein